MFLVSHMSLPRLAKRDSLQMPGDIVWSISGRSTCSFHLVLFLWYVVWCLRVAVGSSK